MLVPSAGQASAVAEHEVNSTSSNVFHWNADTGATSHMTLLKLRNRVTISV